MSSGASFRQAEEVVETDERKGRAKAAAAAATAAAPSSSSSAARSRDQSPASPASAERCPSFLDASVPFDVAVAAAAASPHFVRAATRIQASFRGHKARVAVAEKHGHRHHHNRSIPAHHFPHTGPLVGSGGPAPPRRRRRNPVFVATTSGGNGSCGCPGSGAATIHFDQSGALPSQLEGVYTVAGWVALNTQMDRVLRDTYLPLCPAGLMCVLPIVGALSFMCWRSRLQEQRLQRLEARLDRENAYLQQWGLRWIMIPVNERTRHGRSDEISGFVLHLLMGPAAASDTGSSCRAHATSPGEKRIDMQPAPTASAMARAGGAPASTAALAVVPAPAPPAQRMGDDAGDAHSSKATSSYGGGGGLIIQVHPVATPSGSTRRPPH